MTTEAETISVSSSEAAKIAGVDPRTIYQWLDTGLVKGVRLPNGYRRYYLPSLIKFLAGEDNA